ncbi:AI-2E family transporter [Clostridium botulinum]|uniref:AI-2E family transporter n=1 Tax=Clostridium botulinum TaxID=1491 RepID=UPI0007748C09|nr:AI-2E family transporter [Clostridium botulinum]MBY6808965.1 AI-2E family transporter [Clostridium botulinum]MBY6822330.1 AI-2E family transporter [Clostridium botulinum]MBY6832880.1 AI-2E family transporter [Clostridium botulinum]MBY6972108.1 AI-2E family transporter [Clostridium botulinum]MCS6103644.1 AI-2E family transporter [Clostridium botulinum]
MVYTIFKKYKKIISLTILLCVTIIITYIIKYYFRPFLAMIFIFIIASPLYKFMKKVNIPDKISGALSIVLVNIFLILIILYLGNEIFNVFQKIYLSNVNTINQIIQDISLELDLQLKKLDLGKSVISIINQESIRRGALTTGEGIIAYFIGNICAFFILVDGEKIKKLILMLFPSEMIKKIKKQKENFSQMFMIEISLVLISTVEIIGGFFILNVSNYFILGILCGILDVLPYVGTIIVFIPIIIYNIVMKDYLTAFGLMCLYLLVQVIREILEAKFLSDKLDIHPLIILISIYIGVEVFGILGILVGPMYSILAKEIVYSSS